MKGTLIFLIVFLFLIFLFFCNHHNKERNKKMQAQPLITKDLFGKTNDGKEVYLWTLKNRKGLTAKITNYGGILTSLYVPDRYGKFEDIVLGFDKLENYISNNGPYFGALIGRYANRIAKGRFKLDGKDYDLAKNNKGNHLHGGIKGFDKVIWNAEEIKNNNEAGLKLTYLSKDGEEGYPGNLKVTVTYMLEESNELLINYEAETDKPTPVNLTEHSYFNLSGGDKDILNYDLLINADEYLVTDKSLIPTGKIDNVQGMPYDFRSFHKIGERIGKSDGGYDNTFVLKNYNSKLHLAAKVMDLKTGRTLAVYTTQPGLQLYTGNLLDGSITGKNNIAYKKYYGLCLETEHYPDSPNHPNFPNTILKPSEKYQHTCIYKFGLKSY